jgi:hypothetical protein
MEKRTSDRIHKKLNVAFPCCNSFHAGTVLNLSEDGMLIDTKTWLPLESTFDILIPFKKEVLKVPVKFVRLVKAGKNYKGMGVKLLSLPKKYLEFVIRHKFDSES